MSLNERLEELKSISRPRSELIVLEQFFVKSVSGETYKTSFIPSGGVVGPMYTGKGPHPESYTGGDTHKLILEVEPRNQIPVRKLTFNGISPVIGGNYVLAEIPKYEMEEEFLTEREFYIDRKFNEEELAIELSILSGLDGFVLRKDRCAE